MTLQKQYFLCKKYKCSFIKDVLFVNINSFLSKILKSSILLILKDKISLQNIPKNHFVSIITIQRIMKYGHKELFASKKTLPKVLSWLNLNQQKILSTQHLLSLCLQLIENY